MKKKNKSFSACLVLAILINLFFIANVHATASLKVQMYNTNRSNVTNYISPNFRLHNTGTTSINLSQVKVRYYYTVDGGNNQNFWCDWSTVNKTNVTGNFVSMTNPTSNADSYLEIGFTTSAGTLSAGSSIEIHTRVAKTDWSDYNQSNDYSFSPSATIYLDDDMVTAYLSGALSWGLEPTTAIPSPSPSPAGRKFLIIVSKPLYDYGTGQIRTALDTYKNDLINEGWNPQILTADNTEQTKPDIYCPTADMLKERINALYTEENYEGFVIVGSPPSIPSAFWTYDEGISSKNICTDLFYADMNNWGGVNDEGAYVPYGQNPEKTVVRGFAPEMIYGRISAGCITSTIKEEALMVKFYLDKIHNYRVNGSNLGSEIRNRSLVLMDGKDFKKRRDALDMFTGITPEVYGLFDDSLTTPDRVKQELEKGYLFYYQSIHSSNNYHQLSAWHDHKHYYEDYTYNSIINDPIVPKVHYMNLASCFACQYQKIQGATHEKVDSVNIGAAYLFKNPYVMNVSGQTGGWGICLNENYYQKIADGVPIGQAFKDYISELMYNGDVGCPKGILLGDPTLTYSAGVENKTPRIASSLEGERGEARLVVNPDVPFVINTLDMDSHLYPDDTVDIQLTGNDADSISMLSWANIQKDKYSLTWTPSENEVGNTYNLTVTTFNRDKNGNRLNNKYVENFTVTVANNFHEAEEQSNTIVGEAVVANDVYCSGGKRVGMIGNNSGELIFNDVFARYDGRYTLRVAYKSLGNRNAYVSVNGGTGRSNQFLGMGNWNKVGYMDITVDLVQGYNTIKFYNPYSQQWAPDIDSIELMGSYQAENVTNALWDLVEVQDLNCVGGLMMGNIGYNVQNNKTYSITFNGIYADNAGDYILKIHYKCPEDRTASISVNGLTLGSYNFNSTGTQVETFDILVPLNKGYHNSITITNDSALAPYLDYIEIIRN